jgi:hypothetical protein
VHKPAARFPEPARATQVISRVRKIFDLDIQLRALFESSTVAGLSALIVQSQVEALSEAELTQLLAEIRHRSRVCGRGSDDTPEFAREKKMRMETARGRCYDKMNIIVFKAVQIVIKVELYNGIQERLQRDGHAAIDGRR